MLLDERTEFADAVAIGDGTGARVVGDVIDQGQHPRSVASAEPLHLIVQAAEAFADTSGQTATIEFRIVADDVATLDADPDVLFGTGTIDPADSIKLGATILSVGLPRTTRRFVGIVADVQGEALTAGKVNAFLTVAQAYWRAHRGFA